MLKKSSSDITSKGLSAGLVLPIVFMLIFIGVLSKQFGSFNETIEYYQEIGVLYKMLSLSLMPGAGLFFLWSKQNKLNQARGALLATLMYGVAVVYLYFN